MGRGTVLDTTANPVDVHERRQLIREPLEHRDRIEALDDRRVEVRLLRSQPHGFGDSDRRAPVRSSSLSRRRSNACSGASESTASISRGSVSGLLAVAPAIAATRRR